MPTSSDAESRRQQVARDYAEAIEKTAGKRCCGPREGKGAVAPAAGYRADELTEVPEGLEESSFGCGNPLAFGEVREGEVVLDLGAGAGLDLVIAARRVGPSGRVIGVDMTEAMVSEARRNVERASPVRRQPRDATFSTPRLALVLLLLLAACGDENDRARETSEGTAPTPTLSVRVMSFNLRWDGFEDGDNAWSRRRGVVCQVLADFAPDSVGTQEPMIRQIEDIEAALPTLASYRFDNDPVYIRTQQILYRRDRFERPAAGGFLLADGSNEGGTIRYATWVELADRETGRAYHHYNVHLDHRDARSREQSVVRLMKHIAGRPAAHPFVVTGDFNTAEDSPTMAFLRGERGLPDHDGATYVNPIPLVDTYRVLHPDARDSGTAGGFGGKRQGAKIDHVLVARGAGTVREATIVRTHVDGRYPSDHFPVAAVVEWP